MSKRIEKYTGMVIQPAVKVAEDRAGIEQNLERVCNMIDFGVGYFWEIPVRLIVLPEYFLQGVTTPGKGEHGIVANVAEGAGTSAKIVRTIDYGGTWTGSTADPFGNG